MSETRVYVKTRSLALSLHRLHDYGRCKVTTGHDHRCEQIGAITRRWAKAWVSRRETRIRFYVTKLFVTSCRPVGDADLASDNSRGVHRRQPGAAEPLSLSSLIRRLHIRSTPLDELLEGVIQLTISTLNSPLLSYPADIASIRFPD